MGVCGSNWELASSTGSYSPRQMSGTVNRRGTTLITFDMEFTCVIFNRNYV